MEAQYYKIRLPPASLALFFWLTMPALAAQTCVTARDVAYTYSSTTSSDVSETQETATTTCETVIDESATLTPEYQALRANDIVDRNSAWVALGLASLLFFGLAFAPGKKK